MKKFYVTLVASFLIATSFAQTLNITRQLKSAKQTTAIDSHTFPCGSTKTDLCIPGIGLLASIMMLMPIH